MTGYGMLDLQGATEYPYTRPQVKKIARAIGVDLSDRDDREEHFARRGNAFYLTEEGASKLAAAQSQWKTAGLYTGPIDAIFGSGSQYAQEESVRRGEPIGRAQPLSDGVETREGILGSAQPQVEGRFRPSRGMLGEAQPLTDVDVPRPRKPTFI